MKVKICPKCGTENDFHYPVCRHCQARLVETEPTEGAKTAGQPASVPPGPEITQQIPTSSYTSNLQGSSSSIAPASNQSYDPIGNQFDIENKMRSYKNFKSILSTILVIALMLARLYLSWHRWDLHHHNNSYNYISSPEHMTERFLAAKGSGVTSNVKPYLCKSSIEFLDKANSSGVDAYSLYFWQVRPTERQLRNAMISTSRFYDELSGGKSARVLAVITNGSSCATNYSYTLVLEDGTWKVDLQRSARERY